MFLKTSRKTLTGKVGYDIVGAGDGGDELTLIGLLPVAASIPDDADVSLFTVTSATLFGWRRLDAALPEPAAG